MTPTASSELRSLVEARQPILDADLGPWRRGGAEALRELHGRLGAAAAAIEPEWTKQWSALVEDTLIPWLEAVVRVELARDALSRSVPLSQLAEVAVKEAALAVELDRVVLSRIHDGTLIVEAVEVSRDSGPDGASLLAQLRREAVPLRYPLVEAEMVRRREPRLVRVNREIELEAVIFARAIGWRDYVAAPVLIDGRVIGFLHGDRQRPSPPLNAVDRDALSHVASAFSAAYERAVLRRRLRIQVLELRKVATWADARTSDLNDDEISLSEGSSEETGAAWDDVSIPELPELLTRRELEVLQHVVKGATNGDIARALVVTEGTIKFHVKNILRKLGASNRAEAAARYLQLAMGPSGARGASSKH